MSKRIVIAALVAALWSSFAVSAFAQDGEIDWQDAVANAEVMDTYVNGDGVLVDALYDDAQNVLWDQPVDLSPEEAAEALAAGPEFAALLLITQRIVPTALWLCDNNESSDASCTSGTNYKWTSSEFTLGDVDGNYAYYYADGKNGCIYSSIERVYAAGGSNLVDYCDANYQGYVKPTPSGLWSYADEDNCYEFYSLFRYNLDDSSQFNNATISHYSSERQIAKFRYYGGGSIQHSVIVFGSCFE